MNAARLVEAEILDGLPETDPRARRSRRDLARVNVWMGQAAIMARLLRRCPERPGSIMELGCGDGSFMLRIARRLAPLWPGVHLRLVDRQRLVSPATIAAYGELGWTAEPVVADVFDVLRQRGRCDVVSTNLFLHHFEGGDLRALLAGIAAAAGFVAACEPRRSGMARLGSGLLFAIGCNDVTRHDAATSVRAGFRGHELSALWPAGGQWRLDEGRAGLFTHTFTASLNNGAPA
jgi:hypothetical protein